MSPPSLPLAPPGYPLTIIIFFSVCFFHIFKSVLSNLFLIIFFLTFIILQFFVHLLWVTCFISPNHIFSSSCLYIFFFLLLLFLSLLSYMSLFQYLPIYYCSIPYTMSLISPPHYYYFFLSTVPLFICLLFLKCRFHLFLIHYVLFFSSALLPLSPLHYLFLWYHPLILILLPLLIPLFLSSFPSFPVHFSSLKSSPSYCSEPTFPDCHPRNITFISFRLPKTIVATLITTVSSLS